MQLVFTIRLWRRPPSHPSPLSSRFYEQECCRLEQLLKKPETKHYCPASPPVTNTYCHVCHRLPLVLPMPKRIQTQDNSHRCWWCWWWDWVLTCKDFWVFVSIILPPLAKCFGVFTFIFSLQIIGLLPKSSASVWMRASLCRFWGAQEEDWGFWSLWKLGKLRTSGHVITKGTVLFHISFLKLQKRFFTDSWRGRKREAVSLTLDCEPVHH